MVDVLSKFVVFFSVIDPIGTVPVFIAVTAGYEQAQKVRIAAQATALSALVLIFFAAAGERVLVALDIPLSAFAIAGGLVLFLFALTMIFGEAKPEEELKLISAQHNPAIFPLAVPSIAGPGAMLAAVMQTEDARYSLVEQVQVVGVMLSVLLVAFLLMLASNLVSRLIGAAGASIVSRVMGMILAAVAVQSVLSGITSYFGL